MNIYLQKLKGNTKLKLIRSLGNYYDEMIYLRQSGIIQFEENPFSKSRKV